MNKKDFESLDKMIQFVGNDLRHCIGVDANWVVALALSSYTEAFGHLLPNMQNARPYQCYNEFLQKWMKYGHLINQQRPDQLYDEIRNGLAHEYLLKVDAEVNMGTGPCGIEIVQNGTLRLNLITYYNDFMLAVNKYRKSIQTDTNLQNAFDNRMKFKGRLR